MITVPFRWDSQEYQIRAELKESGEIVHYEEPEYHGNPVDMDLGSLRFRYFGWELLNELREIGFVNCEVYTYWSEELRYHCCRENHAAFLGWIIAIQPFRSLMPSIAPNRNIRVLA